MRATIGSVNVGICAPLETARGTRERLAAPELGTSWSTWIHRALEEPS